MNDNVIPFMKKVEEFTKTLRALSKEDLSEEERTTKTIDSVKLRIYLNEQARNRKIILMDLYLPIGFLKLQIK